MRRRADVAKTLSKVHDNISDLRDQVKEDLSSDDKKTWLQALAAGLLDETAARPGDPYADRDSKGILTLQCRHVSFSDGSATLSYTGKSGVDQKRKVENSELVSTLKDACEDAGPQTEIFQYESEDGTKSNISANMLNDYIRDHGFTAKEIRKYHANEMMADALEKVRKNGPNLNQVDDKEETLEEEFKEALEEVAEHLGHKASTLKGDYLLDNLEDDWTEDGSVTKKYAANVAVARRVCSRYASRTVDGGRGERLGFRNEMDWQYDLRGRNERRNPKTLRS